MCAKCDEIRAAALREAEAEGDVLRLNNGADRILTYAKDGRLTIHTTDIPMLKTGMAILTTMLEKLEAESASLATKQQLMSMAIGALHGWLKSIDPEADRPAVKGSEGEEGVVLSVNMPSPKSKS